MIEATGLSVDLEEMPYHIETEIGERGINVQTVGAGHHCLRNGDGASIVKECG